MFILRVMSVRGVFRSLTLELCCVSAFERCVMRLHSRCFDCSVSCACPLLFRWPTKGIEAVYAWDQTPKLITFSAYGVLYNWHLPIGLIMREALGRAHDYVHRLPSPASFEKNFRTAFNEA